MIIIRKNKKMAETSFSLEAEFAKADVLAKKANALQNEIFRVQVETNGLREALDSVIDSVYIHATMVCLRRRVLDLCPQGVKPTFGSKQARDIALRAALDTQKAIIASDMGKYMAPIYISKRWSLPELSKWARINFK